MATCSKYWGRLAIAGGVYCLAATLFLAPMLECRGTCMLDVARWSAPEAPMVELSKADIRLNTWILAWVQHALATQPLRLFEANTFYPAPRSLAGSEHMLAPAVLASPFRLFSNNAIEVYHLTVALTFVIAGLATYALTHALTGGFWIALVSGVLGMFMPWRISELVHLQLLWACWLPVVWLLTSRCLLLDATPARSVALAGAWTALIFSSYYLAYFSCFSIAAFALTVVLAKRPRLRNVLTTIVVLSVPLLLLAVFSRPYLAARAVSDLMPAKNAVPFLPLDFVISVLDWHVPVLARGHGPWVGGSSLPLGVLLPALFALRLATAPSGGALRNTEDAGFSTVDRRIVVGALFVVCIVAFVMALGDRVTVGTTTISLPAHWIVRIVPGFDFIRAPLRWVLVIATALPVLAGAGLSNVTLRLDRLAPRAGTGVGCVAGVFALLTCVPPALPATTAYPHESTTTLAAYAALAKLPPGPVLEIPWPRQGLSNVVSSSRYMVASTEHWKPLLNGYTGYRPRIYDFLVRVGSRLPEKPAIERLSALTDVRWIVVHWDQLDDWDRSRWSPAQAYGPLVPAYQDSDSAIYEVADRSKGGTLRQRLLAQGAFPDTIDGLPRTPLEIRESDGALAVMAAERIERYPDGWVIQSVAVQIRNDTSQTWPGVDPDPTGLVHVQYRLVGADAEESATGISMLDENVTPHATLLSHIAVQGHFYPGPYDLCVELVQNVEGSWAALGLRPACRRVEIVDSQPTPTR